MSVSRQTMTAVLFLAAVLVSALDMALHIDPFPPENRALAQQPVLRLETDSLQEFPESYSSYFNDHFGFRNALVRLNFLVRVKVLGVSPVPEVVVGKDGWLFYTGNDEISAYRGVIRFDEKAMRQMALALALKQQWLARRGIRYLFFVAPNKSTTYSEYVPDALNRVRAHGALDDFLDYLKAHTTVDVADPRPAFESAKIKGPTYFKLDTHWNQYGTFVAYQALMQSLTKWFPAIVPRTLGDFEAVWSKQKGGDLGAMVGGSEFLESWHVSFKPRTASRVKIVENHPESPVKGTIVTQVEDPRLPRALMFHDSFGALLLQPLSEHFSYARNVPGTSWGRSTNIEALVDNYRPAIVIEEIVERYIPGLIQKASTEGPQVGDNLVGDLRSFAGSLARVIYSVDTSSGPEGVELSAETKLRSDGRHTVLRAENDEPHVVLPRLRVGRDQFIVLEATIVSPGDTALRLFYQEEGDPGFTNAKSVARDLMTGENRVIVPVFSDAPVISLRLDPATRRGEYIIRNLEIYSIPKSELGFSE